MKIIHSSDWHIGRSLYGRKRYEEMEAFLNWLAELITREQIDVLLVAGDVFDNTAPGNRAQELYYQFLCRIAGSPCRHVVITAGNHDSPSFLNAPRELLRFINVHVVGCISESLDDEVLVLANEKDEPELIVCAVPYLRDRDIRKAEAGESIKDKERKLLAGIREHYHQVVAKAEQIRKETGKPLPVIAMGHLFTSGGQTVEGDGVRDLYIGSLAHVGSEVFPQNIDYLALGHLHLPQKVGGAENRRYSGSPLPMGFGEIRQEKSVVQIEFCSQQSVVTTIPVPRFQELESIQGDWTAITARLEELKSSDSSIWLEIIYDGDEIIGDLRQRLDEIISGTDLEILRIKNYRVMAMNLINTEEKSMDDLDVDEVFQRCLDAWKVPEDQREDLLITYSEAVMSLYDEDKQTE